MVRQLTRKGGNIENTILNETLFGRRAWVDDVDCWSEGGESDDREGWREKVFH